MQRNAINENAIFILLSASVSGGQWEQLTSGSYIRCRRDTIVLLPLPLAPTSANVCPGCTVMENPRRTLAVSMACCCLYEQSRSHTHSLMLTGLITRVLHVQTYYNHHSTYWLVWLAWVCEVYILGFD